MNVKLLGSIPNTKTRQRIFQQANDIIAGGIEQVMKYVASDLQDLEEVTAAVHSSTKNY